VGAWPATISERTADGWTLRATPGLPRGRSNHALPPCRALSSAEIAPALARAGAFARRHGVTLGIQVSPLHMHAELQAQLDARGWATQWPVVVMTRPAPAPRRGWPVAGALSLADFATDEWLAAWERCERRDDVAAHAQTVLVGLRGRAIFARIDDIAVAIAVPGDGLLALFCIAVAPEHRRRGLGRAIVTELLVRAPHTTSYLQVLERNEAAISLYEQLGFRAAYRYCHRIAGSAEQAHDREDADGDDHHAQRPSRK
jgi:ribosomal protein S18 acetylase RimI-like enzyme